MEAVTTQDGLRAGSQQLPPKPQCWEHLLGARRLLPGPPHLSQAPRLLPLHPVAMGTSTLQLTEQLARCLFFSFYLGLIFAFISWAPSLPSPGSVQRSKPFVWDEVEATTPRALRCHHIPAASPPGVSQQAPPCALNSSRELDLFPHGRKKSVCLRVAQPVLGVSLSAPRPDGYPL